MSAKLMTPDHKRWNEFYERMEGSVNIRPHPTKPKDFTWDCGGGTDQTRSTKVLKLMGFSDPFIKRSLAFFSEHGGHCDCEVLFNVADSFGARKQERERQQLSEPLRDIGVAIEMLRVARDLLKQAKAPMAAQAVRVALKSAEGAARHAQRLEHGPPPVRRRKA